MSEHTPGPWKTTGREGTGFGTFWGIKHKSEHTDGGEFCRVNVLHRTAEAIATGEANVRLICLSPEWLDAAREMIAALDWDGLGEREGRLTAAKMRLSALIRKAEGGNS